jgi:hypothetical protein
MMVRRSARCKGVYIPFHEADIGSLFQKHHRPSSIEPLPLTLFHSTAPMLPLFFAKLSSPVMSPTSTSSLRLLLPKLTSLVLSLSVIRPESDAFEVQLQPGAESPRLGRRWRLEASFRSPNACIRGHALHTRSRLRDAFSLQRQGSWGEGMKIMMLMTMQFRVAHPLPPSRGLLSPTRPFSFVRYVGTGTQGPNDDSHADGKAGFVLQGQAVH